MCIRDRLYTTPPPTRHFASPRLATRERAIIRNGPCTSRDVPTNYVVGRTGPGRFGPNELTTCLRGRFTDWLALTSQPASTHSLTHEAALNSVQRYKEHSICCTRLKPDKPSMDWVMQCIKVIQRSCTHPILTVPCYVASVVVLFRLKVSRAYCVYVWSTYITNV